MNRYNYSRSFLGLWDKILNKRNMLIYMVLTLTVTANLLQAQEQLKEIYHNDYGVINRTVLLLTDLPEYNISEVRSLRKIEVSLSGTVKDPSFPAIRSLTGSKVLQQISVEEKDGDTRVIISTRTPYYLEYFYLPDSDNYRLVFDIYNKRYPESIEDKEDFVSFYESVGYSSRKEALANVFDQSYPADHIAESIEKELQERRRHLPSDYIDPLENDRIISLSRLIQFNDAIDILNRKMQREEGKTLVDMTDINEPIGFEINKIHWKSALLSILNKKNVKMVEKGNLYLLQKDRDADKRDEEVKYLDNVLIEATFFEADFNTIRELGIDWSTVVGGRVSLGADIRSSDQVSQNLLTLRGDRSFERGETTVDVNTLFRAFSASDKGHIISRPQITVLSGETGNVQDGVDYTILVPGRTAVGDDIEAAHEVSVQSGTIVNVTPVVFEDGDGDKAIHLNINVERSSAQPDVTGYSKTTAEVNSQKVLYNGEETVIGGLITKESVNVRRGIPFLKDLPWWFFGVRYLTGHNRTEHANKELIILIKASILPTVEERKSIQKAVADDIQHQRRQIKEIEPLFLD